MKKIVNKNYITVESKTFVDGQGNSVPYDAYTLMLYVDANKKYLPVALHPDKKVLETLNQMDARTYEEIK